MDWYRSMKIRTQIILLGLLTGISAAGNSWAYDSNALRNMQTAIMQCERGLQADTPRSRVAFQVLNRYLEKYQRYKDAALQADPSLAEAEELYTGDYFTEKPYVAVYQTCDSELTDKVARAEAELEQRMRENQERFAARQDSLETTIAKAKLKVANAVNRYCANFIAPPGLDALDAQMEKKLDKAESRYQRAKQQALEIYPGIVNEEHRALIFQQGMTQNVTEDVKTWFEYCDKVFPVYREQLRVLLKGEGTPPEMPLLVEPAVGMDMAEAPMPPMGEDEAMTYEEEPGMEEDDPGMMDDMAEEDIPPDEEELAYADEDEFNDMAEEEGGFTDDVFAEEFNEFLSSVDGDRVDVLEEHGRLPDYFPADAEDIANAETWGFESEVGENLNCQLYTFQGDTLSSSKTLKEGCPY